MLVSNASDIFQGGNRVVKVLLGSVVIYEYQINTPPPPEPEPEPEPQPEPEPEPQSEVVNPLVGQTVLLACNNFSQPTSYATVSIEFNVNGYVYGTVNGTQDINAIAIQEFNIPWIINN